MDSSLKIDDLIFVQTEEMLKSLKKSRNRYINEALDFYNRYQYRLLIENKLKFESGLVKADSMSVLAEFEGIDDGHFSV